MYGMHAEMYNFLLWIFIILPAIISVINLVWLARKEYTPSYRFYSILKDKGIPRVIAGPMVAFLNWSHLLYIWDEYYIRTNKHKKG